MPDLFVPRQEQIEEILDFDVDISTFINQSEQRRLRGERKVLGFRIMCSLATKTQMQAYRTYFIARFGASEAFTFVSPFDDVTYNVRFVPDSWRNLFASGTFGVSFELKVVY
jgi:hypothetical protein